MRILGHRGAKGEAPENTISGFVYAVEEVGLDAVEFDVRMARDDELVVIHDATVDRTTNAVGKVTEFRSDELSSLDARAGFDRWPLPCGVPTLAEVMDVVASLSLMQIEIKSDAPERLEKIVPRLVDEIEKRGMIRQVVITSFDPVALEILRRIRPQYPLYSLLGAYDTMDWIERAVSLQCKQINISLSKADERVVERARVLGLKIGGWGCGSVELFERAKALQLDCITHDFPSELRSIKAGQSLIKQR